MPTLDTAPQNILTPQSGDTNPIFGASGFYLGCIPTFKSGDAKLSLPFPSGSFPPLYYIETFSADIQKYVLPILERDIKLVSSRSLTFTVEYSRILLDTISVQHLGIGVPHMFVHKCALFRF